MNLPRGFLQRLDTVGLFWQDGTLDRPFDALDAWPVPAKVTVDGDRLVWQPVPGSWVRADRGLLQDFVRLADAPPDKVLAYARRWGSWPSAGTACR